MSETANITLATTDSTDNGSSYNQIQVITRSHGSARVL